MIAAWVNSEPTESVSVTNRGLNFADGHFTTMLVEQGQIASWPLHQQRLRRGCHLLKMAEPCWDSLWHTLQQALTRCDAQGLGVIKIVLTRGGQGRGYGGEYLAQPEVLVSVHLYPNHYLAWQQQGIALELATTPIATLGCGFGIKSLARTEQVLLRFELDASAADDLIVCNTDGEIIEACAANLFFWQGDTLVTPALCRSGVSGVMRQRVLGTAAQLGIDVQVRSISTFQLHQFDGAFVCNGLMKLVPVVKLEHRTLAISDLFRQLQHSLL